MNNSTLLEENDDPFNSPDFLAYSILLAVITLVAGLMMGLTILALLKATSIPRTVCLFLVNLLFAGLLMAVVLMFVVSTSAVLINVNSSHPRPRYLCRVYFWAFSSATAARMWSLAALSLSILAIVRFSKRTIATRSAAITIAALWIGSMILCFYSMVPYIFEAQFLHGVACFPDVNGTVITQAHYAFVASWIILGGLIPLMVSIIVPIVCLCYIQKSIVSAEGTQYRRGIAKLSLFLVVGGSINIAGQILPALFFFGSATTGVYISYGAVAASLLPTPIIIMAFQKPVREEAVKIVTCGRLLKMIKAT